MSHTRRRPEVIKILRHAPTHTTRNIIHQFSVNVRMNFTFAQRLREDDCRFHVTCYLNNQEAAPRALDLLLLIKTS